MTDSQKTTRIANVERSIQSIKRDCESMIAYFEKERIWLIYFAGRITGDIDYPSFIHLIHDTRQAALHPNFLSFDEVLRQKMLEMPEFQKSDFEFSSNIFQGLLHMVLSSLFGSSTMHYAKIERLRERLRTLRQKADDVQSYLTYMKLD